MKDAGVRRVRLRRHPILSVITGVPFFPFLVGGVLQIGPETRVVGAILIVVGAVAWAMPVVEVIDGTLRYGWRPWSRRVALSEIDAFELLQRPYGKGSVLGVGFCRVGSLRRTPIDPLASLTTAGRARWLRALNQELESARGYLPTWRQRLSTGALRVQAGSAISRRSRVLRNHRLYIYSADPRPGDRPRFVVTLPKATPDCPMTPVEVFFDSHPIDVSIRLASGEVIRPLWPLVESPYPSPRWPDATDAR